MKKSMEKPKISSVAVQPSTFIDKFAVDKFLVFLVEMANEPPPGPIDIDDIDRSTCVHQVSLSFSPSPYAPTSVLCVSRWEVV